tara:strand:- start:78 stop:380 length:303 start_codon:yes stop_codon:yes gene_type:complete
MSKDKKIEYCDQCGSKHIDYAKYFCSEGCYDDFNNRLKWSLEQVTWQYLYNHIQEMLSSDDPEIDGYLMSRCSDLVNEKYKQKYNRYPATGESLPLHLRS